MPRATCGDVPSGLCFLTEHIEINIKTYCRGNKASREKKEEQEKNSPTFSQSQLVRV